eukprot:NODE_83_length_22457_cov_0.375794.p14 type:complete len:120 gc:universal NODE_83_length_22457_cov_0.375794:17660-18019(+)
MNSLSVTSSTRSKCGIIVATANLSANNGKKVYILTDSKGAISHFNRFSNKEYCSKTKNIDILLQLQNTDINIRWVKRHTNSDVNQVNIGNIIADLCAKLHMRSTKNTAKYEQTSPSCSL